MLRDFADFLAALNSESVGYVVIGGMALLTYVPYRTTRDLDILIEPSLENGERCRKAVAKWGGFEPAYSAQDFISGDVLSFGGLLRVRCLSQVPGVGWEDVWHRRVTGRLLGVATHFASLEDLIAMKEAMGRADKDLADLKRLRRLRDRGGSSATRPAAADPGQRQPGEAKERGSRLRSDDRIRRGAAGDLDWRDSQQEADMDVKCTPDTENPRVVVASPSGNLEELGAQKLWEVAETQLTADTPTLIIDMTGVKLITSAGVGTLIRLLTRAKSLDGSIAVYGCSERVRTVIEIVRIGELLGLSDSLQEARSRLQS